jgi:hypothetical protein
MSENSLNVPDLSNQVSFISDLPGPIDTISESITNVVNTKINNLINNIELSVVSKIDLEKYLSFIDDPNTKQVVTILTNDSSAVQDIVNMLDLILADGKIDMADAPLLMGLIKKIITLRTSDLKLSQNLTLNHFLDIIKLVFTILAKEGILKIAKTDEFITDIAKLINMIKLGQNVVESMPCFPFCSTWVSSKK